MLEVQTSVGAASGRRLFLLPVAYAVALAALAPVFRQLSNGLRGWLGGGFGLVLGAAVVLVGFGIALGAVLRIRQRRRSRYSLIAVAFAMVVIPILLSDRGTPAEAAVERLHFLLFGLMALLFYRAFNKTGHGMASVPLALLAVSLGGLLDESVQWASAVRTGEMFDVALNAYSGLCGVVLSVGLVGAQARRIDLQTSKRVLSVLVIALALGLACFVELAHLGHQIEDPQIGSFRSLYSFEELELINQRRSELWSRTPPNYPSRPSELEDHFWTEAGDRVRHRNNAVHAEDQRVAFKENQILERYYPAFLELKTDDGEGYRYRLPDGKIDTLRESQSVPESAVYSSDALHRVWLRPSSRSLWSVTALLVLVVAAGEWWRWLA